MATDGRAAVAPELNALEAFLFLREVPSGPKEVRFAATVGYRAIPATGKGRKVGRRSGREAPLRKRHSDNEASRHESKRGSKEQLEVVNAAEIRKGVGEEKDEPQDSEHPGINDPVPLKDQ